MKTAAYLRVLTTDQTPRPQRRGIERYADRAGLDVAAWYVDEGVVSGRTEERPALGDLMGAVREGRFECVQDQVDTASPMGKAMFTIIGAMAELESSLISGRVKAGMEAARAEGTHVGRPATPPNVVAEVERLAGETGLSIRKIKARLAEGPLEAEVSRGVVGRVVKKVRSEGIPSEGIPSEASCSE